MQTWIKKLIKIDRSIERRIAGLERKIVRIALYPYGDTRKQIAAILRATELKRQYALFYGLSSRLKKCLTGEETEILRMFQSGKTAQDIAEKFGWNRQMAYRRTHSSLKTAENLLFLFGYDLPALDDQFYLLK